MTMFKRMTFEDMNQELQEASLAQPIDLFETYNFKSDKAATYHFEDGQLVETNEGIMELSKSWGDKQSFPMTKETFYSLDRERLQRMESSYAVLKEEGFEKMIGRASLLDVVKDDFRLGMKEVKNSFENELVELKGKVQHESSFTFEYETFVKMATYMILQEGEQHDVEQKFSSHSLER